MARGPLYEPDYRPQFSGHETFPLKYGWLKKAVDAVEATQVGVSNRSVFLADEAIGNFGVGKNMVTAIRYWAESVGMITPADGEGRIETTALGKLIFGTGGLDPFMEVAATSWLAHWRLCGRPNRTTWYWVFGYLPETDFDRELVYRALTGLAKDRKWQRISDATVKRDVDCFIRSYASRAVTAGAIHEDELESPLVELGLIRAVGRKDGFRMVRGAKPSLGQGVFLYALLDFWDRYASLAASRRNSLSFEAIAYEPGSPGRVFLLDETDLADRLAELETFTGGALMWSETAGLKQVLRRRDIDEAEALEFVTRDFADAAAEMRIAS
ncbi:DUF4007 family protein [Devosia aurantiaca]|uniref:DUF4007 family protein n=1 Tax=Devosia aurantiaca TaxID=2714858 RepID=A0A6M1S9X1_9HYPH|nr:DUF4007 family protein [Devosia aurantiaca]NGP16607.1 DUF4007 family protein [Devosia aurantiaca]